MYANGLRKIKYNFVKMPISFFQDLKIEQEDYSKNIFQKGEYEACKFTLCNFFEVNISGSQFADCVFDNCNLSMANINNTSFRNVQFINCKMLGMAFDACNQFGISFGFENCQLNHSIFYKTKIKNTKFINCQMHEIDFSNCDLSAACFDGCDLYGTKFENAILEKADFSAAINFNINPEINKIKKAIFAKNNLEGLLYKYNIEIK
jgi:fluoroquinolone resistance protein